MNGDTNLQAVRLAYACESSSPWSIPRMSWRHGWEVFRGESFQANDLVFAVEQGRRFQIKVTMKLFFANNSEKRECDYRVEGSFLARSLKVYKGDSSQVAVEMVKKKPASSIKGMSYAIAVDPNEDLALIIVLLVTARDVQDQKDEPVHDGYLQCYQYCCRPLLLSRSYAQAKPLGRLRFTFVAWFYLYQGECLNVMGS